jgi:hypothetical protein
MQGSLLDKLFPFKTDQLINVYCFKAPKYVLIF